MVRQKSLMQCATTATKSTMARLRASARLSATSTVTPAPHNDDAVRHWKDIGKRVVDTKKQERRAWMKMLKGAVVEQKWGALLATRQANEQILGSALRIVLWVSLGATFFGLVEGRDWVDAVYLTTNSNPDPDPEA